MPSAYFNSIKVRLEHTKVVTPQYLGQLFQFHKGAIRTRADDRPGYLCGDFNSIKVRLELTEGATMPRQQPFQFHKGAIRT